MPEIISRKEARACSICGGPILDERRVKVCGPPCSEEYQRRYQAQYHVDHLEKRRETCRKSWAKHAAIHKRPPRKPLTAEQKVRRNERQRALRARPEERAKRRAKRQTRSPDEKANDLAQKRESWRRYALTNNVKRKERRNKNPDKYLKYNRDYQQKRSDLIAVLRAEMPELLKEFGL